MIYTEPLIHRTDMLSCALCADAPYDRACGKINPSGLLRSIWFNDEQGAALRLSDVMGLGLSSLSQTTDVLERDSVIYPTFNRQRCIGCGRCVISCADGGHQALSLGENRRPILNGRRCVGCHLCMLVCPQRAISPAGRRITPK